MHVKYLVEPLARGNMDVGVFERLQTCPAQSPSDEERPTLHSVLGEHQLWEVLLESHH